MVSRDENTTRTSPYLAAKRSETSQRRTMAAAWPAHGSSLRTSRSAAANPQTSQSRARVPLSLSSGAFV